MGIEFNRNPLTPGDPRNSTITMAPAFMGYKTWVFDPRAISSSTTALVAGTIKAMRVPWPYGETATSMVVPVAAAGSGLTLAKCAIYSADGGTLLCETGDLTSTWASTGAHDSTFTSAPQILEHEVYLAIVFNGTSSPLFYRGNSGGGILAEWRNYGDGGTSIIGTDAGHPTSFPASLSLTDNNDAVWLGVR